MHRVDGPAALPGGLFTDGDPNVGTPATIVTDDWLNAVQEELVSVVAAAGIQLSKPDNAQVLKAIRSLVDSAVPVGTVLMGYFKAAKPGFVFGRGNLVSRVAYSRLWAHVQADQHVVDDATWQAGAYGAFSSGDGVSTFRLPLLGGRFVRLDDDGAGVYPGGTVGSVFDDSIRAHTHGLRSDDGDGFNQSSPNGQIRGTDRGLVVMVNSESFGGNETRPKGVVLRGMIRV
jgi:hypothetical protein